MLYQNTVMLASKRLFGASRPSWRLRSTNCAAGSGSTVRISNSVITQNSTGLNANGGSLVSMSGNSLTGNTINGAFTTTVPKL